MVDRIKRDIVGESKTPSIVVWNLSGKKYEAYEAFGQQVVESDFPGFASPPLSQLVELATSVRTWLDCGEANVAVIHDISGRRSAIVAACVLVLKGEAKPDSDALRVVARAMGSAGLAIVPSQWRYHGYYTQIFKGKSLSNVKCLRLMRVIVNGIPDFVNARPGSKDSKPVCVKPFVKVFYCRQVIGETKAGPVYSESDGCFSLSPSDAIICGDALLRVYHAADSGRNILMFSATFHTAFVGNENVLRLQRRELDGAIRNARFPESFYIDVIFAESDQEPKYSTEGTKIDSCAMSPVAPVPPPAEDSQLTPAVSSSAEKAEREQDEFQAIAGRAAKIAEELDATDADDDDDDADDDDADDASLLTTPVSSKPPGDTTLDEIDALLQGEDFSIDLGSGGDLDDGEELDLAGFASGLGLDDILDGEI